MSKAKKRSRPFSKGLLIVGLFALAGTLYYASLQLPQLTIPLSINEVGTASAPVSLSLSPADLSAVKGVDNTVDLLVNTGDAKVSAVAVEISYDPAFMSVPIVTPGSFLTTILSQPKVENGLISFVLAAPPDSGGKSGSGTLATFRVHPVKDGTSELSFTENTMAAAVDLDSNALGAASGATIQVGSNTSDIISAPTAPTKPTSAVSSPKTAPQTNTPEKTTAAPARPGDFWTSENINRPTSTPASITPVNTNPSAFTRFLAFIRSLISGGNQ